MLKSFQLFIISIQCTKICIESIKIHLFTHFSFWLLRRLWKVNAQSIYAT